MWGALARLNRFGVVEALGGELSALHAVKQRERECCGCVCVCVCDFLAFRVSCAAGLLLVPYTACLLWIPVRRCQPVGARRVPFKIFYKIYMFFYRCIQIYTMSRCII